MRQSATVMSTANHETIKPSSRRLMLLWEDAEGLPTTLQTSLAVVLFWNALRYLHLVGTASGAEICPALLFPVLLCIKRGISIYSTLSPYSSQQENSEARIPSKIDKALTSLVLVHTKRSPGNFLLQPYTIPVAILLFYLILYLTSNIW
jgi:hypothetical protein